MPTDLEQVEKEVNQPIESYSNEDLAALQQVEYGSLKKFNFKHHAVVIAEGWPSFTLVLQALGFDVI